MDFACRYGHLQSTTTRLLAPAVARGEKLKPARLHVRASQSGAGADGAAAAEAPAKSATTSPFAGKKISSLLAARRAQTQEPATPTPASEAAPAAAQATAAAPSTTSLNPTVASLLKDSAPQAGSPPPSPFAPKPASPFASGVTRASTVNAVPAGTARPVVSFGKKRSVVDALKAEPALPPKGGGALQMGQPGAPANIFVDEIRSKEQIEAEKFRFAVNTGQILLVASFFASSVLMMGTVYIVWKLGAIHYNEF